MSVLVPPEILKEVMMIPTKEVYKTLEEPTEDTDPRSVLFFPKIREEILDQFLLLKALTKLS